MVEQAAGKKLQHGSSHGYGAELTTRQFAVLIVAIALGTLLEWYDFFAYSQLNAYLTKVFFPAGDPAVTQLSFWGVYAVGFISRPVGALLFGHLGDTRGRRICLLVSVTMMAIPTVLIGCLPTFAQAGIAAPILLALLRAIQGLAMGGEFGCAMVYLHEIAPAKAKGLVGSIGFASAMVGCMLGVLIVVIVEAIFSPAAQMLIFGWRLPFLLSIISASAAFALRMHMPEPEELNDGNTHAAPPQNASLISRSSSADGAAGSGNSLGLKTVDSLAVAKHRKEQQEQGSFGPQGSVSFGSSGAPLHTLGSLSEDDTDAAAAATGSPLGLKTIDSLTITRSQQQRKQQQQQQRGGFSPQGSASFGSAAGSGGAQVQRLCSLSENAPAAAAAAAAAAAGPADQCASSGTRDVSFADEAKSKSLGLKAIDSMMVTRQRQQQLQQQQDADQFAASGGDASIAIEGIAGVPEKQGEYVPALRLLRKHWGGVLLQFLFEAWVSIGFWVISTWLPLQLRKAPVFMPEKISQAMLIVNLSVMGAVQLAAGWASDKGMPRVWSCFAVFTAAAGISVPVFIGFARCGVAGCWLLHLLLMVLMGWVLGVVPATCSSIYPATVRSSGFNLAHNMAMSWLGGVSPTMVTALVAATGSAVLAPGLLLVVAAVVSMVAALALLKYAPAANKSS
uniref:Major facilitator superfamily (MFS) profile domain-containing protein n=1 Tax=Tetradesmus obliquus TaxID=3088 RepID=A0A383VN35_TETOB